MELLAYNFFVYFIELLISQLLEFPEQHLSFFLNDGVDFVEDSAFGGGAGAVAGRRRRRWVKEVTYRVVGGVSTRGGGRVVGGGVTVDGLSVCCNKGGLEFRQR